MKILIEEPAAGEEEQIIIRCRQMSRELLALIDNFKAHRHTIIGLDGSDIHRIDPVQIYYFEAVDNKVFIYCREKVFESKYKLYEVEAVFSNSDFLRISKSVILNLRRISFLSPGFSGRLEATLDNQEKVIISRQYVPDLKRKLML
jgi:DNA-binding LytR/AlgR family response regulator